MNKKKFIFISVAAIASLALLTMPTAFAAEGGVLGWIFDKLADLYQFFVNIFVPREDYFHNKLAEINIIANDRFGGLAYLYQLLNSFFDTLKSSTMEGLSFSLPNGYFLAVTVARTLIYFFLLSPMFSFFALL